MTNEASAVIPMILPLHILAGALALVFGYTALWASKGAALHRKSGMLFVLAMLTMSLTGAWIAFLNNTPTSVIAGLLTFYFVATGLLTLKRPLRSIDAAAMLFSTAVAILAYQAGIDSLNRGKPEAIPMFIFGTMGLLAAGGDLRMIRAGGIEGRKRIVRHVWRMCFGMWVAAASFFWGPPNRVPELIRIPALLPIPVLTPVVVMLYSMWRLRNKKYFPPSEPNRLSSPSL